MSMHLISIMDSIHTCAIREYGAMVKYVSLKDYELHVGFSLTKYSRCSEVLNAIHVSNQHPGYPLPTE